jgi:hypothetical protein
LKRGGQFEAFGSKAHDKYYEEKDEKMLFDKFKMALNETDIGNSMAQALDGKA